MIAAPRRLAVALLLVAATGAFAVAARPLVAAAKNSTAGLQYVAALHDALDALPPSDTAPSNDPALQRVRAPLQLAHDLSPSPAAVDPIIADLARDPVDMRDARQDLETLVAAAGFPPGSVAEDPQAALGTLHDVYRQSQFKGLGARSSNDDLFTRVGGAIVGFLRWVGDHTVGALGVVPSLVVGGLILAAVLALVLWRLQRSGSPGLRRRAVAEPAGGGVDADEEWRLATEAAAGGDHREAVRHAFRSALLAIAAGRLRVDAAWTTSELLARARGDADLVAALAPAADSFDRAWYSGRPVGEADWELARERCQAVRRLARRRQATAGAGAAQRSDQP